MPHFAPIRMLIYAFVAIGLCLPKAKAMDARELEFNIPEGEARATIREFAVQSELSIIYDFEDLKGVVTRAVIGKYKAGDALKLMLEGGPLSFDEDVETGAFAVIRLEENPQAISPDSPSCNSGESTNDIPKQHQIKEMKTKDKNLGKLITGFLGLLVSTASPQLTGQENAEQNEDYYELSPFVVSSDDDVGYLATSTLAGTRLKTNLNEVGTAISVVNTEFLEDVAATDAGSLLTYTVGTEVGGVDGNFAGGSFDTYRPDQNDARSAPQGNQRVRGLASAQNTRNYFLTDVPFDAYNTDSITINRGPNALLFGIGSPGGVIENSTIKPVFGRDFGKVQFRFDQYGTIRMSADYNRSLWDGRLAVRVAGLSEDEKYRQEEAFSEDRRFFISIDSIVFENEKSNFLDKTRVKGNYETVSILANPPAVIPPNDSYSSFWGLPDPSTIESTITGTLPAFWYGGYQGGLVDNLSGGFGDSVYTTNYYRQLAWLYPNGGDPTIPGQEPLAGGFGRILWSGYPQANMYQSQAWQLTNYIQGYVVPSIQDRSVFDYYNHLFTGDLHRVDRNYTVNSITLEQTFWDNLAGLEVSYDRQSLARDRFMPFGAGSNAASGYNDVSIDVNMYLTNGNVNPNAGRPWVRENYTIDSENGNTRESLRATAFLNLEGERLFGDGRLGRWFGRHVLTTMFQTQTVDSFWRTNRWAYDDAENPYLYAYFNHPRIDYHRRQFVPVVYVGPSVSATSSSSQLKINPIQMNWPKDGEKQMVYFLNMETQQIEQDEIAVRRYLQSASMDRQTIDSEVLSMQSFLLDEHLIGLIGWRKDRFRNWEDVDFDNDILSDGSADQSTSNRLEDGIWNWDQMRLEDDPSSDITGETLTWSLVGVYPEKLLGNLPFGADFRVFYNESENFNPVGTRRNIRNEVIGQPSATTKEYGFMLELLDGKFSVRFNQFETSGSNFSHSLSGIVGGEGSLIAIRRAVNVLESANSGLTWEDAGYAATGYTSHSEFFDAIFGLMPDYLREALNPRFENAQNQVVNVDDYSFAELAQLRVAYDPIQGASATTNFESKGFELELVGNPLPGLRLAMNVARQETVESNIAPLFEEAAREMYQNVLASPLYSVPDVPFIGPGEATMGQRFEDWIIRPLDAALTAEGTASLEQREWRINATVNYTIQDGFLKNFGLGTGLRYQSKVAIGYENTVNDSGLIIPNLDHPYFGDADIRGDVWLSYRRPILHGKVDWKVQLNVRNAIGSDDPIAVRAQPNGDIATIRIPPMTTWFLTNTFEF